MTADITPASPPADDTRPILLVPYMWIGDFVRCHSVVQVLKARWPNRPIDMLATPLNTPLAAFMPGVRKAVIGDIPRRKLAVRENLELGHRLRAEGYGTALIMSRKWKAAVAPFLAGIPERTGFVGEARFLLLNDMRWGEAKLPRMIDQCAALALPPQAALPAEWPHPQLRVSPADVKAWLAERALPDDGRPIVVLAPGAVGPSKRWTVEGFSELARDLGAKGCAIWILGGPSERELAAELVAAGGPHVRDLTGGTMRDAVLALGAATAAVSNDSGLLHVAAAIGTPTIGIFGPTSPWHWAPLNPIEAIIETKTEVVCRPCHKPVCAVGHHRCMRDIPAAQVLEAVMQALSRRNVAVAT